MAPDSVQMFVDVVNCLLHSGNFLGFLIRNFTFKFFFQCHHQFNCIERVGAKIIDERSCIGDFIFFNAKLLDNDFLTRSSTLLMTGITSRYL